MWTIKPTIHNLFFQLLKTTFFSLLACDFSPKHYKKSTAQTSFYHLKICLIHPPFRRNAFRALTLLVGQQEGHPKGIRPVNMRGWWRWALVSPDGVELSWMVGVSASVNLPLHHKVQKFSSDTGSPRWSRKKDRKTVVCVCVEMHLKQSHRSLMPHVCQTFCQSLVADQIPNKHSVFCCPGRRGRLLSSHLSIHRHTAAVRFIRQLVPTGSAPHFMLKFP